MKTRILKSPSVRRQERIADAAARSIIATSIIQKKTRKKNFGAAVFMKWKYDTKIEAYELALIERYFPYAAVFNPSTDLKTKDCGDEEKIMAECLDTVERSGFVIFSSMDGMVG